jgi:hypothetical protein
MHVPQYEVSNDFGLHYTRVSQIIKKVRRWLAAGGDTNDLDVKEHAARQNLARSTHKLRLQRAIEIASYQMETDLPTLKTTRRRLQHGNELWREETSREQSPVNLSAVRLLVRATEALSKLDDGKQPEIPKASLAEPDLRRAVFDLLCAWRSRAEADGCLEPTPSPTELVSSTLHQLLGPTFQLPANGSSSAQEPLNLSAPSETPLAPTTALQTPCADSIST